MMADRIPDAKLIEYKGSSHGFMSQEHDAFIKDLLGSLTLKNLSKKDVLITQEMELRPLQIDQHDNILLTDEF
jgi:hypothetical protein